MTPVALHAVNAGVMTGAGNWTWLLPGAVPTLVDAGVGHPQHLDALQRALDGTSLVQVIVTHAHADHADGVLAIARRMPHVRLLKVPWPEHDGRWPVAWLPIAGGDTIEAGDTALVAVHTPGHAPDHVCLWHAATRSIFCGDLVQAGSSIWIPSDGGDLGEYLASLERVLALRPERMFPAHGPIVENPSDVIRRYLAHRRQREEQILDALRRGPCGTDDLVASVYRGLPGALIPRARQTLMAHLVKLERESRIARRQDAWHIIEP